MKREEIININTMKDALIIVMFRMELDKFNPSFVFFIFDNSGMTPAISAPERREIKIAGIDSTARYASISVPAPM